MIATTDLKAEYGPGGRADVELSGAVYHVRGRSGVSRAEMGKTFTLSQVHGSEILMDPNGLERADGMILSGRERGCGIWTADCLPVFLVSRSFTGAFHAGWRGLAAGIAFRMIRMFPEAPRTIVLGNCICPQCYRVGEDVRDEVGASCRGAEHPPGRLDLRGAALFQMEEAGLTSGCEVFSLTECTMCREDLFHSYRRDGTGMRNLQWISAADRPVLAPEEG